MQTPVPCDFCSSTGPHEVILSDAKGTGLSLVQCACGLRFFDPRPAAEEIEARFASGIGNAEADCCYETGRLNSSEGLPPDEQKEALRAYAEVQYRQLCFATNRPTTSRVYEVGANIGWFLRACLDVGADTLSGGCDINPRACEIGRERLGLRMDCGPFGSVSPPSFPYGVVIANDYIEHTYTPHGDLRKMRRLTVPGGALYLKTFIDELDEPLGRTMLDPPWHAYHFTRPTLRRALYQAGFSVARWEEEPSFAQVTVYATAEEI